PYQGDVRNYFPHSMEFNYLPYSALVKDYDKFDWQPLERMLSDIASRGHQAVLRIFLEYPGRKNIIPEFLIRDGLRIHRWVNTNTQPLPPATVETPDYENRSLRRSLKNFIAAFGRQYDGDPRIGFITAGLLGTWGEWHTYPREELFASPEVQREVMDSYEAAFRTTPILLRYPVGDNQPGKARNADRRFGYHDDSFAWATLDTGKKGDEWFFMSALKAAGPEAEAKWKRYPIGGEIRPEAWGKVFDPPPRDRRIQDFRQCVEATHVTWLMDSGMFEKKQSQERIARAMQEVRRMGYEFHVSKVRISKIDGGRLNVNVYVENRGVAPFYYDWKPEYGLMADGKVVKTFAGSGSLKGILPDEKPARWTENLDIRGVEPRTYQLLVRVPNPMPTGKPVRFANATSDVETGWLKLDEVEIR
ncbi:MAG: DUF4832 domain-containing protein, partial [Gemmataceae bacterium]|nr:DUF4832 domain-containing protein [Gemmataceae bacterium]